MINEKMKKNIIVVSTIIIVVLIIWFLIISPLIQFKKSENKLLEAGKRYFEINSTHLPTGTRIKTISLQTLYDKDFISEDLKVPNSSKTCDAKTSWIKVQKKDNEYKYHVYLKCGIFSSKTDHKGPTITLNGEEEVTINKGEKYKDPGIKSVEDNTDGKMDIKDVKIDNSNLNVNKNGTYKITYTIKDSLNNETIKTRTVKVVQILDKIVENKTDKTNYYKGQNDNNYIKLDGILFKIVGLNEDGSVKITSSEPLAFVDYNSVDTWLNDYFYEKLSDSAKEYIKTDSKWCNEKITDTTNYTKCDSYSKKKAVGLLSVADINNSKDKDGVSNLYQIQSEIWTNNLNDKSQAISYGGTENKYSNKNKDTNLLIYPTLNIKKDSYISKGNGYLDSPYVLKGNTKNSKAGELINNTKAGEYLTYSGYTWRIIGKEDDETTKIIMDGIVNLNGNNYYTGFASSAKISFNTTSKDNIGYILINKLSSYVKSDLFEKKKISILNYNDKIGYEAKVKSSTYNSKLILPSAYDLFSTTLYEDYWFANYSSVSNTGCYMNYSGNAYCEQYNNSDEKGIRVVAYLNKNVTVKTGDGTLNNPYTLSK